MTPLPVEFVGKTVGSVKEKSPPDTDVVGAPPFTHIHASSTRHATSVTGIYSR
ncbi:MAG: hypothetical protein ACOCTR_05160 [Candidatus Natronoplasma sp.]